MSKSIRLRIHQAALRLQEFNLEEVSLDVYEGEYFVLLGPTGSGKTVLLEAIAGVKGLQRGSLYLDGEPIHQLPPEQRRIGFVYQDYALFPHLSVRENIAFGLNIMSVQRLRDLRGERNKGEDQGNGQEAPQVGERTAHLIKDIVNRISRLLKIEHILDRDPKTLSGGEKQRVALARALVIEPHMLLLDEPLSALDPETSETLQRELKRIHHTLGTTTLHITHNFEEAVALADRIGVMMEGRIVQVGSPQEIFRRPADEQVARFVGVRNIFQGRIEGGPEDGYQYFHTRGLVFEILQGQQGEARCSIRPEDIILSREPIQSSARNHFQGIVREIMDRGTFVYVSVGLKGDGGEAQAVNLMSLITRRSWEEMELSEGDQVCLAFKASAMHVF